MILAEQKVDLALAFAEDALVLERGRIAFLGKTTELREDEALQHRLLAIGADAKEALQALAQEFGALLATTLPGKGLFDGNPFALDIAGTWPYRRACCAAIVGPLG